MRSADFRLRCKNTHFSTVRSSWVARLQRGQREREATALLWAPLSSLPGDRFGPHCCLWPPPAAQYGGREHKETDRLSKRGCGWTLEGILPITHSSIRWEICCEWWVLYEITKMIMLTKTWSWIQDPDWSVCGADLMHMQIWSWNINQEGVACGCVCSRTLSDWNGKF